MTEVKEQRLADEESMPKLGSLLGGDRYEILSVLGEGGFAAVYKALDSRTKTHVAIKVLDPLMSRRKEFSARFLREVETVSRLKHHNTIKIFDSGETDQGCLYLVMELLDGQPLDNIIEDTGPLAPGRVKHIAVQILKSLNEAHELGVIHRDLKPANVFIANMLGESDYVKVLDFGIAKSMDESADKSLTATGQVMCSPDYVSPERVRDHNCFPSSDLYSLGVMMIEMLEGELPYKGDSPMMVALQHARVEDPVPMRGPSEQGPLGAVIRKAVSKDVTQRYQTAAEMLEDLVVVDCGAAGAMPRGTAATYSSGSTTATTPGAATVAMDDDFEITPPRRRGGALVAVLALLLLGGGAAGAYFAFLHEPANLGEARAPEEAAFIPEEVVTEVPEVTEEEVVPEEPEQQEVAAAIPMAPVAVNTTPQSAQIFVNDELMGQTPFLLTPSDVTLYPATIRIEKEGYETWERMVVSADELVEQVRNVTLNEVPQQRTSSSRSSRSERDSRSAEREAQAAREAAAARSNREPETVTIEETGGSDDSEDGSSSGSRIRIGSVPVRIAD